MYSRIGDISSSRIAFESLKAKDVVSWTAMLLAFTYHGHGDHALHVFGHMLKSGTKPDEITFVGVLSACSHAGLVKKGQKLFDSMSRAYGLEPRAEHYSCLVDILGRAGQVAWNVEMADYIGQKLIELQPNSSGGYVLLANVFAARGNWDEFAEVRKKMKDRNVRKVPGFSQIEVKGKCHAFFAGDKSHPQVEEIYELLREKLLPIMHEMGYSQWNQFVPSWF
ncbi:Pentatricopeptide repeat-containing protein [Vitis vinifera]|uniref:Pentatricopeptide repeat-containing protein n=1 Tax=Vitis vinifera TaxID=29760 RepID=A0A438BX21_VITVI|nr:Pentatricopeptide repeat-containing protein [Vitis vinifera]